MSALPEGALHPIESNQFQTVAIERPDDTILTDEEIYQLKGGNNIFLTKFILGAAAGLGYIHFKGELVTFRIRGLTFFWANLLCISAMLLTQRVYLKQNGLYNRYKAHQLALYHRYVLNMGEITENKKKPKFH